jgi:hypothetical protein
VAKIQFLKNEANKVEGLAYAGFETFRGSPYTSCARETGQNSRDAAIGGGAPVKVEFNLREIPRTDVPFADELQHSIECCLKTPRDAETKEHLERAKAHIMAPIIKVLEIADINTTGLTGPVEDENSVFAALVKGDGVTNKSDPTSAGSYGIGKNAAYAVSDLQTVIYSTRFRDKESDEIKFAAQGRLRLISHTDGDQKLSAEGYWGNENFTPITSLTAVPTWVAREMIGTSIFSVGFREQDHWADRIRLSLVTNFFLAIVRNEIEFSVDRVKLNQSSIYSILESAPITQVAEVADETAILERAKRLMQCIESDAAKQQKITIPELGDFTLHLLIAEGMPREIHILRNGIYIADNFGKFGLPMRAFRGTKEYIAVVEPARSEAGKKPSQLLKQLENPAHDAFEPERIVDPASQKIARAQIKLLVSKVRDVIKDAAKLEEIDHSQLDELSHLFSAGGASKKISDEDAEKDPDRFQYGVAKKNKRKQVVILKNERKAERQREGDPQPKGRNERVKPESGHRPTSRVGLVSLDQVRSKIPQGADARNRTIFFTPSVSGNAEVSVSASGLSEDVVLGLASASVGTILNGRIQTTLIKGQRTAISVIFSEPFRGPIELGASGIPAAAQEARNENQ